MKRSKSEWLFDAGNVLIMLFMIVVTLYPFYHVIMASLSDSNKLMAHTGVLFGPLGLNFDAYRLVFKNPNITSGYLNTLYIVVAGTTINMILTTIAGYALSRDFLLNKTIMLGIVFTMFFSGGLIPNFLLVNNVLHLGNTYWSLILPGAINTWNFIIMRTSFKAIPESLVESARIDGAGDIRILARIVIPLSYPVLAVMLLYYGVAHWNSWFQALLYLRDRGMYPLQLILREILVLNDTNAMSTTVATQDREAIGETIKYATIVVATLPILLVYPMLQKYFVKGVMIGAIKE